MAHGRRQRDETREERIIVRLTTEEREQVETAAERRHLTLAGWCRGNLMEAAETELKGVAKRPMASTRWRPMAEVEVPDDVVFEAPAVPVKRKRGAGPVTLSAGAQAALAREALARRALAREA